jgi:hypothetical protein
LISSSNLYNSSTDKSRLVDDYSDHLNLVNDMVMQLNMYLKSLQVIDPSSYSRFNQTYERHHEEQ